MGSRRSNPNKNPQLPAALRWLRHEARLTQSEVAEKVRESGFSLSDVYYRQCESDAVSKYPSEQTLTAILGAVGSNETELEQLLEAPPWEETASAQYDTSVRMRKDSTPKPSSSYSFLRSHHPLGEHGSFSSTHQLEPPQSLAAATPLTPDLTGAAPVNALFAAFASTASPASVEPAPAADPTAIDAEVSEIASRYRQAPRGTQLTVLGLLRRSGGHS